jgi:glycosyltransferase involved in cell wall biosynthesis
MARRVAVITTEFGIPSEVWMVRQLTHFHHIAPVVMAWGRRAGGTALPDGIPFVALSAADPRRPTLWQRQARRLGLAAGHLPSAGARAALRAQILGTGAEAVLCHFAWTAIPVVAAVGDAIPVVAQVHGRDVSALLKQRSYRAALQRTLPRLAHLVVVGRFQIGLLRPLGLPERTSVIPCGAPFDLFGRGPLPTRNKDDPIRFLSVGRIDPEKGVLETLSAFERVVAQHPNAELIYAGRGPLEGVLSEAIARSPAREKVRCLGFVAPAELARLLPGCHVLVQHSRPHGGWIEGFGVTLTEAGAAGLALVASDIGGIPDQIEEGRNGFLFPEGDIAAQAEAMLRLAEDEPLRQRMGEQARAVARGFDASAMSASLEKLIVEAARA